jgi:hypothetical protein
LEATLHSLDMQINKEEFTLGQLLLQQQQMKRTTKHPLDESRKSKTLKTAKKKQFRSLSAALKTSEIDHSSCKQDYQRSIEVLRQGIQLNNQEEEHIKEYIAEAKQTAQALQKIEAKILLAQSTLEKNYQEDLNLTKRVQQMDESVALMMHH